jgi:hypothetical protein
MSAGRHPRGIVIARLVGVALLTAAGLTARSASVSLAPGGTLPNLTDRLH